MTAHRWRRSGPVVSLVFAVGLLACQEELTAPGKCPELCPGSDQDIRELVLPAVAGADTTYEGYVGLGQVPAIIASTGIPPADHVALVRFLARPATVTENETEVPYTIDSVAITFRLAGRDTNATGVTLGLYRMPVTIDSMTTFADIEPFLVPANRFGTLSIGDAVRAGADVRVLFTGADLANVDIPPSDEGVLALAAVVESPVPTGVRLNALASGAGAPTFSTFVTAQAEGAPQRTITRFPAFNGTVRNPPAVDDRTLLEVGGAPSARSYLRFEVPPVIRDSATLVRATLELVPAEPIWGIPTQPAILQVFGVRSDVGPKSPLCVERVVCGPVLITRIATAALPTDGSTDTVSVDIFGVVRGWQGSDPAPSSLFVVMQPEGGALTRALFHSTRQETGRPVIRINYVVPSGIERP